MILMLILILILILGFLYKNIRIQEYMVILDCMLFDYMAIGIDIMYMDYLDIWSSYVNIPMYMIILIYMIFLESIYLCTWYYLDV